MKDYKDREAKVRKVLKRLGLALVKSPAHLWNTNNQQGYQIVDPESNSIVAGENFDLSLHDVEKFAAMEEAARRR